MTGAEAAGEDDAAAARARFSRALDAFPAAFTGNPLHLLFVPDAFPITAAPDAYLRTLDAPGLLTERREYLRLADAAAASPADEQWPFPAFPVRHRPDPARVSEVLFERFESAPTLLPTQADIGPILVQKAAQERPDIVALMIADGLSYYDLPSDTEAVPCLVNGVSITAFGYRAVVGQPSVAQRLFAIGYRGQQGFTYYDRADNALASDLYALFGDSQVRRVGSLDEALQSLRAAPPGPPSYVQITVAGLDHLSHHHPDRPLRDAYLTTVLNRFADFVACLTDGGKRRVLACLTADHGILWRDCLPETGAEVVSDLFSEDARHPRYVRGGLLRHYGRVVSRGGETWTLLRAPYLTRKMRAGEWGVHGGISAWESLVPLLIRAT